MTAGELVAQARSVMHGGGRRADRAGAQAEARGGAMVGTWPRAAALLARQALEQGLDDFWSARAPRVRGVSRHAQLLCLGAYLGDRAVVDGVRHAWHGLSRACHHQVYELPPTAGELEQWLDAVDRLLKHDPMAA